MQDTERMMRFISALKDYLRVKIELKQTDLTYKELGAARISYEKKNGIMRYAIDFDILAKLSEEIQKHIDILWAESKPN